MSLVVDASVAVCWFFNAPNSERAQLVLRSGETIIAPEFVIAEIVNAAWKFCAFGKVSNKAATTVIREAADEFDELVPTVLLKDRALAIALELRHPVDDCLYLALAEHRRTNVISADRRLLDRCASTAFASLVRPL